MTKTSIVLKDVYVNGVNTSARANGVKKILFGGEKFDPSSTEIPILCGVNFEAKHGDKIAIIGRNGCGKSSLLKVISGIYPTSSGYIKVSGTVAPLIEMGLGLISAFFVEYGLLIWAFGFGLVHIVYGIYLHYKYER